MLQVGRHWRSVSQVADDLGCDWHTVMDAMVVVGGPLIDDPACFGAVSALGLDETFYRWARRPDRRNQVRQIFAARCAGDKMVCGLQQFDVAGSVFRGLLATVLHRGGAQVSRADDAGGRRTGAHMGDGDFALGWVDEE